VASQKWKAPNPTASHEKAGARVRALALPEQARPEHFCHRLPKSQCPLPLGGASGGRSTAAALAASAAPTAAAMDSV
jgi:hypothetical protein